MNFLSAKSLAFDPVKDLVPITMVAAAPQLVIVHASVPVSSLKDLIAHVKARPPGQFKFGSGVQKRTWDKDSSQAAAEAGLRNAKGVCRQLRAAHRGSVARRLKIAD